jgi:SagB-type dehydrogenase family enzyme
MSFKQIQVILIFSTILPLQAFAADSLSIGQLFHQQTSSDSAGLKAASPIFGDEIPLYKQLEWNMKVALPVPQLSAQMSLSEAIDRRASNRNFSTRQVSLTELSRLLISADGITHGSANSARRAAPSAGALYPIEIYLVVTNVDSLPPGLYHFDVSDTSLQFLQAGDLGHRLQIAANGQQSIGKAPVTLVFTSRFARVTHKYADRGYRYAYMEAGAIAENVYLQSTALGLGTVLAGAFNDDAVNAILGINGKDEAALIIMPVGHPAGENVE